MSGQATGWVLRYGPRDRAMRAVLVTIADAANRDGEHAHPGIPGMIEGSCYTRSTVFDVLRRLTAEGWIEVEAEGGGRGRATVYRIPGVALGGPLETVRSSDGSDEGNGPIHDDKRSDPVAETVRSSEIAPITSTVENNGREQHPPYPPSATADAAGSGPDGWAAFWDLYPRKVGKPDAEAAYRRALVRAGAPDEILAGLRDHVGVWERYERSDHRFIPHPATWLNQMRWNDAPPPERQVQRSRRDAQMDGLEDLVAEAMRLPSMLGDRGIAARPTARVLDVTPPLEVTE